MLATPGESFGKKSGEGEKGNHANIGGDGRESGGSPGVVGVERSLMQREDGDESDIGKHDARHRDGFSELVGLIDEARRSQPHKQGHVQIDKAEQRDLRQDEQGEHLAREPDRFLAASGLEYAGIGRQIGRVERPLAEDLAKLVGQLDRRDIGVVKRAAAHERRERHIAQEARQSRGDRPTADQEDVAVHCARFSRIRLRG